MRTCTGDCRVAVAAAHELLIVGYIFKRLPVVAAAAAAAVVAHKKQ